jgi:hypothetical protein
MHIEDVIVHLSSTAAACVGYLNVNFEPVHDLLLRESDSASPKRCTAAALRCCPPAGYGFTLLAGGHRARMTTEEANADNRSRLQGGTGGAAGHGRPRPERLARRAHNRLQSGWDEQAVRQQWPRAFDEVEAAP